jgi:hypothetical protein
MLRHRLKNEDYFTLTINPYKRCWKLNGRYQLLAYIYDSNIMADKIDIIEKNT